MYDCVCFGEVLFDILPNEKMAGGAPLNVAYHLSRLGKRVALISRIGKDRNGSEMLDILQSKEIPAHHIQLDEGYMTGIVMAMPDATGDMTYEITEQVAWDFIELRREHEKILQNSEYFVFGSLATRSATSRNTLFNLIDDAKRRVFDANLRAPFIERKNIEYQMQKADLLKVNEEELNLITEWYVKFNQLEDKVSFLQNRFHIPGLIVTRGAKGAVVCMEDSFYYHSGMSVNVADTIGSGDSFLAAFLAKMLEASEVQEALSFAAATGALIATKTGGCPDYSPWEVLKFKAM